MTEKNPLSDSEAVDLFQDINSIMDKREFSIWLVFCAGQREIGGISFLKMTDDAQAHRLASTMIDVLSKNPNLFKFLKDVIAGTNEFLLKQN